MIGVQLKSFCCFECTVSFPSHSEQTNNVDCAQSHVHMHEVIAGFGGELRFGASFICFSVSVNLCGVCLKWESACLLVTSILLVPRVSDVHTSQNGDMVRFRHVSESCLAC